MEIKNSFISRINGEKVETIYKDIEGLEETNMEVLAQRIICIC